MVKVLALVVVDVMVARVVVDVVLVVVTVVVVRVVLVVVIWWQRSGGGHGVAFTSGDGGGPSAVGGVGRSAVEDSCNGFAKVSMVVLLVMVMGVMHVVLLVV